MRAPPRSLARTAGPAAEPVRLGSHAAQTLDYIRTSIEAAGSFAVPGLAGIVMGLIGAAAAVAAWLAPSQTAMLQLWLAAAVIAFLAGSAVMWRQATIRGTTLYRGPARKFVLCLAPSLAAGAVLTFVLWRAGLTELLPGTWLLLYGAGVLSASAMTARSVAVMGAAFVL